MNFIKKLYVLFGIILMFYNSTIYKNSQDIVLSTYAENEVYNTENRLEELSNSKTMSFSFLTDLHGDYGETSTIMNVQAFRKLGTNNLLDFAMCAGDMTTGAYDDLYSGKALYNLKYYSELLSDTDTKVLFARGNHDCNTRKSADVAISGLQYYETVLSGLKGTVVFNEEDLGGDYYYYDIEDKNIRVCVLNAFNGDNYEFIFGDTQLNFVKNEVLDLSNKDNSEDWQVLFLTHTVDESSAHSEIPSDSETLYSIINDFQDKGGTVIAIITGHHHIDSTTIKNNILIITVRSASIVYDRNGYNTENYDENDLSFDVFTVDTESKTLYSTKVGRGEDRQWSYDIDNLQEEEADKREKIDTKTTTDGIISQTIVNNDNNLVAIVKSDSEFVEKTNKTWKLSKDGKTYIKILDDVTDPYTTSFTNINGDRISVTYNINKHTVNMNFIK